MVTRRTPTQKDISSIAVRRGISAKRYLPEAASSIKGNTPLRKANSANINSPEIRQRVEKKAYEESLTANAEYNCPRCGSSGESQIPFKRKKIKMFNEELQKEISADALQFQCQKCSKKINVTKKMK